MLIRQNFSVDAVARELLPLTAKYFELLSEIAWRGYQIEAADFSPPLVVFREKKDDDDKF